MGRKAKTTRKSAVIRLILLLSLCILFGCASTKQIEQARAATEAAMKAAQEAAKRAESIAVKLEEGVKEANRSAARATDSAKMA